MLSVKLADDGNLCLDERQQRLERYALRRAAAWSDFDAAEQAAAEIVKRFGAIEARDLGLMRLHREPMFTALQTACVIAYRRPFTAGNAIERIATRYGVYSKLEWQTRPERLFIWAARLSGDTDAAERKFVVPRNPMTKSTTEVMMPGEAAA